MNSSKFCNDAFIKNFFYVSKHRTILRQYKSNPVFMKHILVGETGKKQLSQLINSNCYEGKKGEIWATLGGH